MIEYLIFLLNLVLGITGWMVQDELSDWTKLFVLIIFMLLFILEIKLLKNVRNENDSLNKKINEMVERMRKSANLDLIVNDVLVSDDDQVIEIGGIDGIYNFSIVLKNKGNLVANDIQVYLDFPEYHRFTQLGNHWIHNGYYGENPILGGIEIKLDEFAFIAPVPIHPKNWLTISNAIIDSKTLITNEIPIKFKIHTRDSEMKTVLLILKLK